ncbi:acyl-CoA dehydrogenase [Desulforegula conservatrix]|uniref:acyl-CoA dehydrogenase n=1 Tax=Desulforegula conservatrix TaxID=153026 RepID=UPI000412A61C|nr:acyl-CoA dehydrogenase [Desulforegula conservatrix]
MAQQIADRRDQDFVLHEMFEASQISKHEDYAAFNKKTMDMTLTAAREFAIKEILPTMVPGDKEGVTLENGQVKVPPSFHKPYKKYCEGEWVAMCDDPEYGGQGMPHVLAMACGEMFTGANCAFLMYPGLTHGCGNIIASVGSEKQKELYLKKLYTGEWGGTMCLTEANAGSDVGALESVATLNADGTYNIVGNKIFISGGDSDMVPNVIHPVLARIIEPDGSSVPGTPGISLFIVPKLWVNDDGSIGEDNDVTITGVEHKMGIHGNATCSIAFGSKGKCRGYLIGDKNKGMRTMFLMMNEARQGVALQGHGFATHSYMNAVNYAKERKQGPDLIKAVLEKNITPVPIIQHPDVRRNLLMMKTYVEGMRSLIYYLGWCFDMVNTAANEDDKAKWNGLIEIITPIAKAYCTDKGCEVARTGIQIYGGYGFIEEYPQAQLLRDCIITAIYEGTNGIQAMDLLGRKLGMKKGKPLMDLLGEVNKTIAAAKAAGLEDMAEKVQKAVNKFGEVAMTLGGAAMSEKVLSAFANATPFCEVAGDVIMSWLHLWRASVAQPKIEKASKKDKAYYEGQVIGARFFIEHMLPTAMGKMIGTMAVSTAAMDMPEDAFIG